MTETMNAIKHISFEEYQRISRVNMSTLKEFRKSPAHYRHRLLCKDNDSPAKRLGRAVHLATLEPERFVSTYVIWNEGRRFGKKWDKFKKVFKGREILTNEEYARCLAIQQSTRSNQMAMSYLASGAAEITATWIDKKTGIGCKGRLDFANDSAIVDLKTTRDASPNGFGREVWRYGYHLQAAFYQDGHAAATGTRLPIVIIAVETEAPYVVQVYSVPEQVLDAGREEYSRLLELLATSRAENNWPGYSEQELELTLPRWATNYDSEEDVSGLDLDFGTQTESVAA